MRKSTLVDCPSRKCESGPVFEGSGVIDLPMVGVAVRLTRVDGRMNCIEKKKKKKKKRKKVQVDSKSFF